MATGFQAAEDQFASFRIWTAFLPGSCAGQDGNTSRAFELVRPDTPGTTRNAAFRIPTTLFLASAEIPTHCRSRLLTSASETRTGHSSKFYQRVNRQHSCPARFCSAVVPVTGRLGMRPANFLKQKRAGTARPFAFFMAHGGSYTVAPSLN
jgi:hypothetical protein